MPISMYLEERREGVRSEERRREDVGYYPRGSAGKSELVAIDSPETTMLVRPTPLFRVEVIPTLAVP